MFFLYRWWAKFKYGEDAVEDFEKKGSRHRPRHRPKHRANRRPKKK